MAKGGPGKFDSDLHALLYELSMEGVDQEVGDSSEGNGWAGLMKGDLLADVLADDDLAEKLFDLDAEEIRELAGAVGCIVSESPEGFVGVGIYGKEDEHVLDDEWEKEQMQYGDDGEEDDA